ncbi:MAG: amylo-alpha-1,6-glucosidase [Candidatus Woesearchaeota archaeon]
MKIVHDFQGSTIKGIGDDNFILTNGIGGYASLSDENVTKFQGVYFTEGFECYKVIENIFTEGKTNILINRFTYVARDKEDCIEYFFMPRGKNAFIYELSKKKEVHIILDCRKQLDFDDRGRKYRIYFKDGIIFIDYSKTNRNKIDYHIYIAIIPNDWDYKKVSKWEERNYSYDIRRGSLSKLWVYNSLVITTSRIVFGFGTNEEKAKENALSIRDTKINSELPSVELKFILDQKVNMAYLCAQQSLYKLITSINNEEGIFAGFYWFNQFWTRDELVSVGALLALKDFSLAKKILMKQLKYIGEDGRLPNRNPPTNNESADSIGWLFKRFYDLFKILEKRGVIEKYFSNKEIRQIKITTEKVIHSIIKNYSDDGVLIRNNLQETWMDTKQACRDGLRIEIQALQLAIYRFLALISSITKDSVSLRYADYKEKELKKKVRETFWNGHYLKDGKDDETIRPNIFLVYYVYPYLLSRKEWVKCFDNILPRLYTGFGLSSLDIHNKSFHPYHTGENDESYHNGDSWYWLNNIAAISLYKVAKFKYAKYIHNIMWGSTNDLLWQGIPGAASEISSAKKQEAFGAFCQAWSNATYIEMIKELF